MNHYNSLLEEGTRSVGGVTPSLKKGRAWVELDSVWIHMKYKVGRVQQPTTKPHQPSTQNSMNTPHIITEGSTQYILGEIKENHILYDFKKISRTGWFWYWQD